MAFSTLCVQCDPVDGDGLPAGTSWGGWVVLTVSKITASVAAGYADYLQGKAQGSELGDYYLKDGERVEAAGRWVSGATAVGADPASPVAGEALRALMAVQRPDTGGALRRAGGNGVAVAAIDATFSAPKSVSAAWALASPGLRAQMERAQELAVDRAVAYSLEQVAMVRERVDGQTVIHCRAADVIATSWRHTTARAVEGRPPDPQLHSHVLIHAAVRRDRVVVAVDSRKWFVHRRELGAAYRTELACELSRLGFEIRRGTGRDGRYFELEGVPQALIDQWSGRHHQVQEAIKRRLEERRTELQAAVDAGGLRALSARERATIRGGVARLSAAEDRFAAWSTRASKSITTNSDLDGQWAKAVRSLGFGDLEVQHLRAAPRRWTPADLGVLLERLTEFDATFDKREARAVALEASTGIPITDALGALERLGESGELCELADGRQTTRVHRGVERQTVLLAEQLAATRTSPLPVDAVDRQTSALDAQLAAGGARLATEQWEAIDLACSDRRLVTIVGQAGSGKSTALIAIARAHQTQGQRIIVTSTGALAAQRLANELAAAGVHARSYSTVALDAAISAGRLDLGPEVTLIHDEAALASTREQHRLLTEVLESRARLIAVGDPRQSHPVGASGLWPMLEQTAIDHDAHVQLTHNVRARDHEDRRDQALFRAGEHQQALRGYHSRRRVTFAVDQRHAEDRALEAAHADQQDGKRVLVVAQTSNEHLDELNARAQAIRHQHHELGDHSLRVTGRPYRLHAGDQVQIRRSINHPESGQLRNGTTGQVTDIAPGRELLKLRTVDGRELILDRDQVDRADVRLSYVQHPFPAQGQTTDTTHLIVSEHATREGCYVALTRARHRTRIHASRQLLDPEDEQERLPALAAHMGRSEPDVPSISTPLAHETEILNTHARELEPDAPALDRNRLDRSPARDTETLDHDRNAIRDRPRAIEPRHLTAVLGPRPDATNPGHAAWQHAADAIGQYRTSHNIPADEQLLLGPEPAAGAFQQRHDRRQAADIVLHSLNKLDPPGFQRDPLARPAIDAHVADPTELARDPRAGDRTNGWEM